MILAGIVLLTVVLGARDITSEGAVSLQGDVPRYMMNGVFMYDFIASGGAWSTDAIVQFAERYYARYPALSLGHHPPLASAAMVPFYAVFGVSVWASRLATLAFFVLAALGLFSLARRLYDAEAATWATVLFVTSPVVLGFGQVMLAEMPMIALVLAATIALVRFCDTGERRHYLWFVAAAVASLYAKQLAVFMFPVYAVAIVVGAGWRRLVRFDVVAITVLGALLSAPMVLITLSLSAHNVSTAVYRASQGMAPGLMPLTIVEHLTGPMLAVIAASIVTGIATRDRYLAFSLGWIVTVIAAAVLITGSIDLRRYAVVAMPAYFLCAAGLVAKTRAWKPARWAALVLVGCTVGWQVWASRDVRPVGAGGYEAAARYVVSQPDAQMVLFSGPVDTGYFTFFVRKHDPAGRIVVLRSDKMFTVSEMRRLAVEELIDSPEQIYPILRSFGVRYIVIEDRPVTKVLEWLRTELKTDKFVERLRIPIATGDYRLQGVDLAVYEYKDAQPPDPEAVLDLKLRIVGREIKVRVGDLITPTRR